jgi:hypothetical protein
MRLGGKIHNGGDSMSKKDYIKFAAMFKEILSRYDGIIPPDIEELIMKTADIFYKDNKLFDVTRYIEACYP